MSQSFQIRSIREGDIQVLHLLQQLSPTVQMDYSRFTEFVHEIEGSPNHFVFVMESNQAPYPIVGTATIWIEPKMIHRFKSVGHIEDVVIDGVYRGQGLGKVLVEELIDFAKKKNCYKVILNCDASKADFYEKCGFERWGLEMRYHLS